VLCHLKFGPFSVRVFCREFRWLGEELRSYAIKASKVPEVPKAFVIRQGGKGRPVA
jgi:hypothetical protein